MLICFSSAIRSRSYIHRNFFTKNHFPLQDPSFNTFRSYCIIIILFLVIFITYKTWLDLLDNISIALTHTSRRSDVFLVCRKLHRFCQCTRSSRIASFNHTFVTNTWFQAGYLQTGGFAIILSGWSLRSGLSPKHSAQREKEKIKKNLGLTQNFENILFTF